VALLLFCTWFLTTSQTNGTLVLQRELVLAGRLDLGECVSKFESDRWKRRAAIAFFISPLLIVTSAAQVRPSPGPELQKRLVRAADRTLQEGLRAQLPPHLSTLLGISAEKECPVRQGLMRTGKLVQGFDVSTVNTNDVVLFVVNGAANDQTLYLTSREGSLRKVVSVKAGVGRVLRISAQDRKAFEKEKQFWLDRLAPAAASK
jgi:hypothetical protein